ncbi:integration host factor subunit alpha [Syntrophus aciditrophicus]|jgi:integration host factor subunit alpha|uniref:Integration host factor subunit alpha n=1 Tax=Syntrophus aciditrophicus (strain SB) TaxID=56780 RepID=Q2LU73_SYNAS|nr:integration host factor subunit alpha [Syntrophus aciditrophicus]ABC77631.1 DNA-binding protein HU [Syntrophus aciditrophicus SB]OPY14405.1 MAG: Integration host factor subunit alpha [Syntrophus sp. PtaB.Bin075]
MPLTKNEMMTMLYNQLNISRKECVDIVESFFEIIKSELEKGNPVMISGFGKWTVRPKRERKGRNPQTGEDLTITARKVVTFKASPNLISSINP